MPQEGPHDQAFEQAGTPHGGDNLGSPAKPLVGRQRADLSHLVDVPTLPSVDTTGNPAVIGAGYPPVRPRRRPVSWVPEVSRGPRGRHYIAGGPKAGAAIASATVVISIIFTALTPSSAFYAFRVFAYPSRRETSTQAFSTGIPRMNPKPEVQSSGFRGCLVEAAPIVAGGVPSGPGAASLAPNSLLFLGT